jgi:hypothetical protein
MVVDNFYVLGTASRPAETYSILVVYANAVLADPLALELFKALAWWNAEVFKTFCNLHGAEVGDIDSSIPCVMFSPSVPPR